MCAAKNAKKPADAVLVFGGVEPLAFTNLFPVWCVDERARDTQIQVRVARRNGYQYD